MRIKKSDFGERIAQAEQRIKCNRQQGIDLYQRALDICFNQTYDSWFDYYTAKIELCNTLKDTAKLFKGRKYLEEIIKEVNSKDIETKLNHKKMLRIKYSATHTFAKLQLAFSDKFDLGEHYVSFRKAMNESYRYFKDAFQQILEYLINSIDQDEEIDQWWSQQYLKIKSNYIQLIFNQAEKFRDKRYFQIIFDEVQKVKSFLQLVHSKQGEIHLYRCYYYKSMSLRGMERFEQSYRLLLDDYKFELANNQFGDAEKSRRELLKVCLDLNMIQQVFKYVDSSNRQNEKNQRMLLNHIIKRRQIIKKHFSQDQAVLRKCDKDTYQCLFQEFDDQQESSMGLNQYRYDITQMIKYILKVLDLYKSTPSVKGLLLYYLAQSHYRLQKYNQAEYYIAQAIKIPVNNQIEMRDLKIQEFMIKSKNNKGRPFIQKTYNELSQEISKKIKSEKDQDKLKWLQNQKKQLLKIYNQCQKFQNKSRQATFYSFQTERQNELVNLVKNFSKKKKQDSYKQKSSIHSGQQMDIQGQEQCIIVNSKKPKRVNMNPQEEYRQKCEQFDLPFRQLIKQNITSGNLASTNPLIQVINMQVQQLLSIIPLLKVDNLDLRNHQVNNEVLSLLEAMANHESIRCFKISGFNNLSSKLLLNIIKKMGSLSYLSFVNFSSRKHVVTQKNMMQQQLQTQPKSIVEMLALISKIPSSQLNPNNIRVLKLKYCNLLDYHIEQLGFSRYSSLQEVSLSHNLLQGRQTHHIMNLLKIKKVNFSDNPLQTLSFNNWKGRLLNKDFSLEALKVKNIDLNSQFGVQLSFIFEIVRKINLSQCRHLDNLLQPLWNNYFQGKMRLNMIEELKLTHVDLGFGLQRLINILNQCSRLRLIDLRFSKLHNDKGIVDFKHLRNVTVKISEEMQCEGTTFDLLRF